MLKNFLQFLIRIRVCETFIPVSLASVTRVYWSARDALELIVIITSSKASYYMQRCASTASLRTGAILFLLFQARGGERELRTTGWTRKKILMPSHATSTLHSPRPSRSRAKRGRKRLFCRPSTADFYSGFIGDNFLSYWSQNVNKVPVILFPVACSTKFGVLQVEKKYRY